jgi:DNA-binding MarR family transcriptional regulator
MPSPSKDSRALLADPSLDLERRTNYRFALVATLHMRHLAGLFTGKHQLTAGAWRVLGVVGRYGPVFPSGLAELTSTDAYKVTRTVDRLVEMGLVERSADTADRRRVQVRLSPRGRKVYEEIDAAARGMELQLRAAVSEQEWKRFCATLDKLDAQARQLFAGAGSPAGMAGAQPASRPAPAARKAAPRAAKPGVNVPAAGRRKAAP